MKVRQLVWAALGLWLAAVFVLGFAGAFVQRPGVPPLAVLLGAVVPLAVFLGAYRAWPAFRAFVLSADLPLLTVVQAWRAGGLMFLALYAHNLLPGHFAWPAGLGDMAIGVTAPWIALALTREPAFAGSRRFVAWNLLGILDLAIAMSMGALGARLVPDSVLTTPMAQMPLVLVPAYLVPLFVMLHLTALFQAARLPRPSAARGRDAAAPT